MRLTVSLVALATQMVPWAATMAVGSGPAGMGRDGLGLPGSISDTVASRLFDTHTLPALTATPCGPLPVWIRIGFAPARPPAVLIRSTVPLPLSVTHTVPWSYAIPIGA